MGKFTVERWRCDRCGKQADKWLKPSSSYDICVNVEYGTDAAEMIDWREMCAQCNHEVGVIITAMAAEAKRDRERIHAAEKAAQIEGKEE